MWGLLFRCKKELKNNDNQVFGVRYCKIPHSFYTQKYLLPAGNKQGPQYRDWPDKKESGGKGEKYVGMAQKDPG